jgi:hypothetical protein
MSSSASADGSGLERTLLVHLLQHRGHQVRFEADQWTTEFGILRAFAKEEVPVVRSALRSLEMTRYVYRRVQYVVGYSEPKLVYSLTASGHRKALDLMRANEASTPSDGASSGLRLEPQAMVRGRPTLTDRPNPPDSSRDPSGPPEGTNEP